MKKVYLTLLVLFFSITYSFAQWSTNGTCVYYNGGNVSIGTNYNGWRLTTVGDYCLGDPFNSSGYGFTLSGNSTGLYMNSGLYGDGLFHATYDGSVYIGDVSVDQNGTNLTVDDPTGNITAFASNYYNFVGGANFGINTITPISNFQVNDGAGKTSLGNAGNGSLYGTGYLGFNAARAGTTNWTVSGDGIHNGGGVIYNAINNGEIYFAPIENTGTTGKTLTDADVKSRIQFRITPTATYAKQIYVETTGWPDFVFKKDYSLRSLAAVKSYINQNHHLPDMPAAEKVEKDGINLGEMNKALLKKVEELTLYMIEKDKEIKTQLEINKQQQQVNQSQEEKLKKLSDQLDAISRQITAKN